MAALPQLISVEQFRQLPEGEYQYELHHGEVVAMTRPRAGHVEMQYRLLMLLGPRLAAFGAVRTEYPYRPFPEFDIRVADVAAISRERWEGVDSDDNLYGTPELVVEVKSPSNTERQLPEPILRNPAQFRLAEAERSARQPVFVPPACSRTSPDRRY
jgi:Uma2 family endonuclease